MASETDRSRTTLNVAAEVAAVLQQQGVRVALIGAGALAVHGYPRSTRDLDLATEVDPFTQLRDVERACRDRGWQTHLALPDADDPLGGVLTIRGDDFDPVQVVNFHNPLSMFETPATEALLHAVPLDQFPNLPVVRVEHLILLKLYAGGPQSRTDVVGLLESNPQLGLDDLRVLCRRHALEEALDTALSWRAS